MEEKKELRIFETFTDYWIQRTKEMNENEPK